MRVRSRLSTARAQQRLMSPEYRGILAHETAPPAVARVDLYSPDGGHIAVFHDGKLYINRDMIAMHIDILSTSELKDVGK